MMTLPFTTTVPAAAPSVTVRAIATRAPHGAGRSKKSKLRAAPDRVKVRWSDTDQSWVWQRTTPDGTEAFGHICGRQTIMVRPSPKRVLKSVYNLTGVPRTTVTITWKI